MSDIVRRRYDAFARLWYEGYCHLYSDLAFGISQDEELVQWLARAKGGTQPNLFFAALMHVTGRSQFPKSMTALNRAVREDRSRIEKLLETRRNQTNEVGRCAALALALPAGPLSLLELGTSAGLCLWLDHYGYDFGQGAFGPRESGVVIAASAANASSRFALPRIVWRMGVDIEPIDVRDEPAVAWLESCVWAGQSRRLEMLRSAVRNARRLPACLSRGDVTSGVPIALERAPEDSLLVVIHSATLSYVSPDSRRRLEQQLVSASERRPIVVIGNEICTDSSTLAAHHPGGAPAVRFALTRRVYRAGRCGEELLALVHPHGDHVHVVGDIGDRHYLDIRQ